MIFPIDSMEAKNQSTSWRLIIPLLNNSLPLSEVLGMGFALVEVVRQSGGTARCLRRPESVTVELTGMAQSELNALIDAFTDSMTLQNESISLCVEQVDDLHSIPGGNSLAHGEYFRGKLTKRLLISLPEGAYVASNIVCSGKPVFAVRLTALNEREAQWIAAVEAGAAQRTCNVLWNAEDVLECHGVDLRST